LATWIGGSAETPRNLQRASSTVWRTYKVIALLDETNAFKKVDLAHSSAASDIVGLVMNRLRRDGDLETGISPNFRIRNGPPALVRVPSYQGRISGGGPPE
jgi:hypothetical protein